MKIKLFYVHAMPCPFFYVIYLLSNPICLTFKSDHTNCDVEMVVQLSIIWTVSPNFLSY